MATEKMKYEREIATTERNNALSALPIPSPPSLLLHNPFLPSSYVPPFLCFFLPFFIYIFLSFSLPFALSIASLPLPIKLLLTPTT